MIKEEAFKSDVQLLTKDTIAGIPCTIGYIKTFKWRWLATQLNTFIIIGETSEKIDAQLIGRFSSDCMEYALKNNKGWPRGLQAAVASISILEGSHIDESAIKFCEVLSRKHWSAFEIPVLYDTQNKKLIRFKNSPLWGRIYFPFFAKTIDPLIKNFS